MYAPFFNWARLKKLTYRTVSNYANTQLFNIQLYILNVDDVITVFFSTKIFLLLVDMKGSF
ncbi:MAG: hypothetical protein COA54_03320 [Thiotrichaceae bacterium]|nr:MAG: hypothetical protein COA54_03320 [Thiotrichaceae bacterium]